MKRLYLILAFVLVHALSMAQSTKVRGRVLDAGDGAAVPFAAVFFEGSEVGISADANGNFSLSTRDLSLTSLRIQQLGYATTVKDVKPGVFNELVVMLRQESRPLDAVTIKADNSRAKQLLANIDSRRHANDPEQREGYSCDIYSRMELDITHPEDYLDGKAVREQWGFVLEHVDTSEVSGTTYLPVLINETLCQRKHRSNPKADREVILANRMSGSDPDGNLAAQFSGSIHLRNNFYDQYLNIFDIEIPSPIHSNGLLYYNYFIVDSLSVEERKTYMVNYHPKAGISSPAFDGMMLVDAEEHALKSIKARLLKGQNVNWIRDMVLEASYSRQPDSTWFYSSDRFYVELSVSNRDSSQVMSFIGNRQLDYMNPSFEVPEIDLAAAPSSVREDAFTKDMAYWETVRPYPLSEKEQNIYTMVSRVQKTSLYNNLYDVTSMVLTGYYDVGYVGFGPLLKMFSYNPLEGFRLRLGVRTTKNLLNNDRFMLYAAYGFRDHSPKGGIEWEHVFGRNLTRRLSADIHYDVVQLGSGSSNFNQGNIFSSVLGGGKSQRLCTELVGRMQYEHEFASYANAAFVAGYREFFSNAFVPAVTPDGQWVDRLPGLHASAAFRFSKDETVLRGDFVKTYLGSRYPVLTLELEGGASYFNGTHAYFKPQLTLSWEATIAPIGMTYLNLNLGTIVGRVPYHMLHLHEGNGTYLLDRTSFSTMDFFEYASDSWVTMMWEHNFNGFFLGKIPLIRKLNLREAFILKATWGYLSPKNDGRTLNGPESVHALLLFPQNTKTFGKVPYVETGFAITNILRLFRVDFIWRVTHRDQLREHPRNFVVNAGIELKF